MEISKWIKFNSAKVIWPWPKSFNIIQRKWETQLNQGICEWVCDLSFQAPFKGISKRKLGKLRSVHCDKANNVLPVCSQEMDTFLWIIQGGLFQNLEFPHSMPMCPRTCFLCNKCCFKLRKWFLEGILRIKINLAYSSKGMQCIEGKFRTG